MPKHHVVIGGGPAATNAVESIRGVDKGVSQITLVCDEPAHSRMALPYWLAGQIPREHTFTADGASWQRLEVDARIGVRVEGIDTKAGDVYLSDGTRLGFDDLLIATGSSVLDLPVSGGDLTGVQSMWTLSDTEQALAAGRVAEDPRVVLIGAGFIGLIVLNAMFKRGWRLTVIEREPQVLPRMLDSRSAALAERWLVGQGVDVRTGAGVRAIRSAGGAKAVEFDDGTSVEADLVIVATGVQPNLDLLGNTGIAVDQGIQVDDSMRTNHSHIYAAGDVAQGPVLFHAGTAIHAIQPTAVDHGRVAGANMAGSEARYPGSLLMNVLDVCGLQCASFGNWSDANADAMTIHNPDSHIHRHLSWTGDMVTGAIFVGQANDLGMLNDVGMVKGIVQTGTTLGPWKEFLAKNPFDIRRAYVATGVAQKLVHATLLGEPSRARRYRFRDTRSTTNVSPAHSDYMLSRRE